MRHTLILDNLNCAHCASKIETKIAETEGFGNVSFNFATKKLLFEHEAADVTEQVQAICDSIEDGVHVLDEHEHHHDHHEHHDCHGEHCGCHNHDHDHDHDHNHHHGHGKSGTLKKVLLTASVLLGVAALALHLTADGTAAHWTVFGLSLAATLCAGYDVFLKGIKNAFKLRIEETVLITIAVIAAFCIGETVEAAMVTILFSIGECIEDLAVGRSRRDIEKLSRIRPDTATVLANGQEREVPAKDVAIGSVIVIDRKSVV